MTSSNVHARRHMLEVYPTVKDLKCIALIQLASTETLTMNLCQWMKNVPVGWRRFRGKQALI